MKRFFVGLLQFILLLLTFLIGSVAPAFGVMPSLEWPIHPGRVFVYNGLLLMLALYVLFLLIGLLRKRLRIAWPTSTVAVVLALVIGLLCKFGFKGN
jgi:lysylphosphatidylglycerol synthetase-like protein (DUF2156 family)